MRLCNARPYCASTSLLGFRCASTRLLGFRFFVATFGGVLCLPDSFYYGFTSAVPDRPGDNNFLDLCYYQLRDVLVCYHDTV